MFARLVKEAELTDPQKVDASISDVFESAFSFLKRRKYRHEYIYKAALAQKILMGTHSLNTASMLTEFRVGRSKADVAILNGTGTVYEIKSERDTLSRLKHQLADYASVFAVVNVIVGENHLEEVLRSAPRHTGVMVLSSRHTIRTVREGKNRERYTCPRSIFHSVNLKEAELILRRVGMSIPDVPNTVRYDTFEEMFCKLKPSTAHREMVEVLKKTRSLAALGDVVDAVPPSLQMAMLTTKFKRRDRERLMQALHTPVTEALAWE